MPSGRPTRQAAASEPRPAARCWRASRQKLSARVGVFLACSERSFQAPETSSRADGARRDEQAPRAVPRGRAAAGPAHRRRAVRRRERAARSRAPGDTRAKVLPAGVTKPAAHADGQRQTATRPRMAAARRDQRVARPATAHERDADAEQGDDAERPCRRQRLEQRCGLARGDPVGPIDRRRAMRTARRR